MLDQDTQTFYRQLAAWLAQRGQGRPCPVFGINGAQGSGKSTAAAFLRDQLASAHELRAVVLSLDDFYLPRAARLALAAQVHPLLVTRGVPGSHEVALGIDTLQRLKRLPAGESLALPAFSKAEDDRLPAASWPVVVGPVDLILFEGWCVGLPAQAASALRQPINALEASEDADGRWRRWVNEQLATRYADWFAPLDALLFLQVPDFDCVRRWRGQQEQDTARRAGGSGAGLQSGEQLERFIQHYQRLTAHALAVLPARAEVLLRLGEDHRVMEMRIRELR